MTDFDERRSESMAALIADPSMNGAAPAIRHVHFADVAGLLAGTVVVPVADLFARSDGEHLFYEQRINVVQGEPESGKSWVSYMVAADLLKMGAGVVFLDLEDTATAAIGRLRQLDVDNHQLLAGFRHLDRAGSEGVAGTVLVADIAATSPDLVVIDSVGELMSRYSLAEDKAEDVFRFRELIVSPLCESGATLILIDHVAKDKESRGRWARGSGAKLGVVDGAAYSVSSSGFNRTTAGRITLTLQKDRHGSLPGTRGDELASIYMQPDPDGGAMRYTVNVPAPKPSEKDREAGRTEKERHDIEQFKDRLVYVLTTDGAAPKTAAKTLAKAERKKDRLPQLRLGNTKCDQALAELIHEGRIIERAGDPSRGEHQNSVILEVPAVQQTLPEAP